MPTCVVKDIPIHYEIHGTGRPLLAIHGWGVDHRLMTGCLEPFFKDQSATWQRIYLDLPGMGQTPGARWIDGSDAMLEVVSAFIDAVLPEQRFLLAGESYGGYLARGLVARMGERIDGLFLLCPLAHPDTRLDNASPQTVLERDPVLLASLSEAERGAFGFVAVRQTGEYWARFRDNVMPAFATLDQDFLANCLGRRVPFGFAIDRTDAAYPRPVLILTGRQDNMVGYKDQWQFLEAYPRASFVVLDKAGHALESEQAGLFRALLAEWLERVEAEVR